MFQLSCAIATATPASNPYHLLAQSLLLKLSKQDSRPSHLREMAYRWCSATCEKYPDLKGGEELLFLPLKAGFHGLDVRDHWTDTGLVYAKHHQHVGKFFFDSRNPKAILDLLQAWTTNDYLEMPYKLLYMWPTHLIQLPPTVFISQRLQRLVIRSVKRPGFLQVEQVGVEEFTALLDCLGISGILILSVLEIGGGTRGQ